MPELDRLYYTLGINTGELEKGIRSVEDKFNRLAGTIGNIAATIGLAFGFKQMVQDIKQLTFNFDQAMRQVWTLTDQTEEEFDAMRRSIIELSKEGPYSATELANALYQVISAGVDASQAMDFLQLAMKSAQAGATDLFTAVDGLTTVLNAWGLQMKDLEAVSDAIFVAVREGKTTFQELAQSIGIVAPTASQAGVSLEEVLSAVAALTKQGINTQRAMTSLNYAIQSIIAPSEKAKETAQNLGIEFNATQLKAMGLAEFLKYVADAANGDTEALRDLFGSVEALRGVFALTGTAAQDFNEILAEIESGAGETEKAASKMTSSLENQFKRLQNTFDAIKLKVGEALTPLLKTIADLGERFATWIENMSPAERTILAISGALLALIPVIKTATFVWGLLSAVSGSWVGAIAGIAATIGALTVAFGMMRTKIQETTNAGEQLTETFDEMSKVSVTDFAARLSNALSKLEDIRSEASELLKASDRLVQLAVDYNYAQKTGIGNAEQLREEIEELLRRYPSLRSAVALVGNEYEIQIDQLQKILELELQRIDLALEQAKIELEAIKSNKEFVQSQEEMYRRLLDDAKQRADTAEKLVQKYKQIIETTTDESKKTVAIAMMENFEKAAITAKEQVGLYSQKLGEVLELKQRELALEQQIAALQETRSETEEKILQIEKGVTTEPTYAKKLADLDKLIEDQKKKLSEYEKKTGEAYEIDYQMLRLYTAQKMNLLRTMTDYMIEQGASPERVREIVAEIQRLEKELEQYTVKEAKVIDFAEIERAISKLSELTTEDTKEIGAQIYRQTKMEIINALTQAYIEGNQEAITKLEEFRAKLRPFESVFELETKKEKRTSEENLQELQDEIQKLFDALNKAIEQGNMELAQKIYFDLMSKLSGAIQDAFILGNEDLLKEFKEWYEKIQEQFGSLFTQALTPEKIQANIEQIKAALYEGQREIAESLSSDLLSQIDRAMLEAFLKGDKELFGKLQEQRDRLATILARDTRFQEALTETTEAIRKQTEITDESVEKQKKRWQGYTEMMEILQIKEQLHGATLEEKIQLYERLIELYHKLGVDTEEYKKQLEYLKAVQEEEKEEQLRKLEESIRALETQRELELEAAEAAQKRRYQSYNELLQIRELQKIAQDETKTYSERIEALEEILNLQKQIGEHTSIIQETEEQITSLKKEQARQEELKQKLLAQQKNDLQTQADFLNQLIESLGNAFSQFGEVGELITTVLNSIEFTVEEILQDGEVIGYKLVNPFEQIEELTANIQQNIAQWAIGSIANMFVGIVSAMQDMTKTYDKFAEQSKTQFAILFENFKEYKQNVKRLQELQAAQIGTQIGSTAVGGLIGFFLGGPLGALIGAGIGAAVGTGIAQAFDEQIEEIKNKLKATWQEVKEALGTDIDSVASALERAFSANTYEDFVSNFSQSLEEMTKQALIKAFLASEAMQPLFDSLSDTITTAVLDGVLTAEEMQAIRQAAEKITEAAAPFFEALQQLFDSAAGTGIEHTASESIRTSITEETANRLAALLSTINLNVATIKDKIVEGIIKVEVTNLGNYIIAPREYLLATGG